MVDKLWRIFEKSSKCTFLEKVKNQVTGPENVVFGKGGGGQLQQFREPKEAVFFWVVIVELFPCASSYSIFLTAKLLFFVFFG